MSNNVSMAAWRQILDNKREKTTMTTFRVGGEKISIEVKRSIPLADRIAAVNNIVNLCAPVTDGFVYDDKTASNVVDGHRAVLWQYLELSFRLMVIELYTNMDFPETEDGYEELSELVGIKEFYGAITEQIEDDLCELYELCRQRLQQIDDKKNLLAWRVLEVLDKVKQVIPSDALDEILQQMQDLDMDLGDVVKLFPDGDDEE